MLQPKSIKPLVRGIYDLQKLRIQMGNRIVTNYKARLGQEPGASEEELDEDAQLILRTLRNSHKRLTDGVVKHPRRSTFTGDEVIGSWTEFVLINQYLDLEKKETEMFRSLEAVLEDFPIYNSFLHGVRGIGPAMAAVIVSEFDIHKAKYASSMWKYAGLDVAEDGAARSKRKEHLHRVKYLDREGKEQERDSITFNTFIRTKLLGVLGPSFLRSGNEQYAKIYYDYRERLVNHPAHKEKTKKHQHNMAIRYMVKMFLIDLYREWKTVEGLPVYAPYHEAKLGLVHHG